MSDSPKDQTFPTELFSEEEIESGEAKARYRTLESAIWTQRKALLIRLYLDLFVKVTCRGTYIDAFAGPQYSDQPEAWAANLVWNSDPGPKRKRLDRFELFEKGKKSFDALEGMLDATDANKRLVYRQRGDCNTLIPAMLAERPITSPAFCLLDQRSTECSWALVQTLAEHKQEGAKIELFYFLMASWKDRSVKNLKKNPEIDLGRWWGRDDIGVPYAADRRDLCDLFRGRFESELGYKHVHPFPIYDNVSPAEGGTLKYYMIHASDNDDAPKFMFRAYNKLACGYDPSIRQEEFEWNAEELKATLSKVDKWDGTL